MDARVQLNVTQHHVKKDCISTTQPKLNPTQAKLAVL